MKFLIIVPLALLVTGCATPRAPTEFGAGQSAGMAPVQTSFAPGVVVLPADTIISATAVQEITSIKMVEGDVHMLQVANDIAHEGVVIIPRGAPIKATVTWRTGKGIGGKSAKFDLTFNSVTVRGQQYALKGKHRQEGKGNTVAALLGSMLVSGRSAIISSGQVINGFTAQPIPAS